MSIYHLRCLLRFQDGRTGDVLDTRTIEAGNADDAIRQAKLYECENLDLTLVSLALSGPSGTVIGSLQSQADRGYSDPVWWLPARLRSTVRGTTMRMTMLEVMRQVADDIVAEEAFAAEFAEEAAQAERMEDTNTAEIMRDLARRHRVEALELDGRLAALRLQYAMIFEP